MTMRRRINVNQTTDDDDDDDKEEERSGKELTINAFPVDNEKTNGRQWGKDRWWR